MRSPQPSSLPSSSPLTQTGRRPARVTVVGVLQKPTVANGPSRPVSLSVSQSDCSHLYQRQPPRCQQRRRPLQPAHVRHRLGHQLRDVLNADSQTRANGVRSSLLLLLAAAARRWTHHGGKYGSQVARAAADVQRLMRDQTQSEGG